MKIGFISHRGDDIREGTASVVLLRFRRRGGLVFWLGA
jgi:hypothetical protein